ncbi:Mur ligase family protein [Limnobacter parvus]|uniref:Mur ligase family protein n=1 Tax=Limnobacter parvus TaxID=2939690 RepID=A0ABT1XDW1_9BURK|nr:Mur ligase family protein [Limnobacter parvus]MCR2745096.1 Mur ligase family protein [Limnobacter parvus]
MNERLDLLRVHFESVVVPASIEPSVLILSFSDGSSRATVATFRAATFGEAWQKLHAHTEQLPPTAVSSCVHLRIDLVVRVEPTNWGELKRKLSQTKRNYFTRSIALDAQFEHCFVWGELNGNAMFYDGSDMECAALNVGNFESYARKKYGQSFALNHSEEQAVWLFDSVGAYCGTDGVVHPLVSEGVATGRRELAPLTADSCAELVLDASEFLARQVKPNGMFVYGLFPCFNREIPTYNTLRHASSTYAMLEAWELTKSETLKAAIDRSLNCLCTQLIKQVTLPGGIKAAFLVDTGNEIKLGGNAVCILALAKYTELTGSTQYLALAELLAQGIVAMLNPGTRQFVHVLNYPELSVKQQFRIIYYDGEAAFALMRLYKITRRAQWLQAVELAFEYFIEARHWKANDHWLSYCVNELTLYRPKRVYFEFGIRNFINHLDFVQTRITTFPTLLELMMAAEQMLVRLQAIPEYSDLYSQVDVEKFYRAMHWRANYLLNGFFWPEWAMYFGKPSSILGSFFIRHQAYRVRIDDVEHYLSGLLAYRRHLLNGVPVSAAPSTPLPADRATQWHPSAMANATGGIWLIPPPSDWVPQGVCSWWPSFQEGQLLTVSQNDQERGVSIQRLSTGERSFKGIMATQRPPNMPEDCGLLLVDDTEKAVVALGRHARSQMRSKVIGVTGSAGKTTTVALLCQVLGQFGSCAGTQGNANLPVGIAWNMANALWENDFFVAEMAIGRMHINAQLARPHVAVVTNIGHAHLEYHHTLEEIAQRKARIFEGVEQGGFAVINRDTDCFETLEKAANKCQLNLCTFGRHASCHVRLLGDGTANNLFQIRIDNKVYPLSATDIADHILANFLACVSVVYCLGLSVQQAVERFGGFKPLAGRGSEFDTTISGKQVCVIDESYNANPLSTKAAILHAVVSAQRRGLKPVLVLGDMLELADQSETLHRELLPLLSPEKIKGLILLGEQMRRLAENFSHIARFATTVDQLDQVLPVLSERIEDGDVVLFKGSHGTGLHEVVATLMAIN